MSSTLSSSPVAALPAGAALSPVAQESAATAPAVAVAGRAGRSNPWSAWLPIALGLLVLYVPSYVSLMQTTWDTPENGHGPIMLAVFLWLVWRQRRVLIEGPSAPAPVLGWLSLAFGLLLFVLGRSQSIDTLEVASHLPVLIGILLLMRGLAPVKALWFALTFMLFMIPLPGLIVEAMTSVLKEEVSVVVEQILYWFGYPIARSGVVLLVGQYQLLMADACSGLNSLFSLGALGMLLVYLTNAAQPRGRLHIAFMLLAILPIAFLANVIRVIGLVLITWYFGDEAGQGLAHGATGLILFVVALLMLLAWDRLLRILLKSRASGGGGQAGTAAPSVWRSA